MQALSRTTHSRTPTQRCEDGRYLALERFISRKAHSHPKATLLLKWVLLTMYSLQPVSRCCQDVLSPFRHQTGWNLLIHQAEKRNFDFQKSELRFFISKNLLRGGFLQCQHLTDAISEHSHMTLDYFYGQAGELFLILPHPQSTVSGTTIPELVNRCQNTVRYPARPHEPVC